MQGLKGIALVCAAGLLLLAPSSSQPWLAGLLALVLILAVIGLPGSASERAVPTCSRMWLRPPRRSAI